MKCTDFEKRMSSHRIWSGTCWGERAASYIRPIKEGKINKFLGPGRKENIKF